MAKQFVLDIETLGVESTSIVLSAAMIWFDAEVDFSYEDLLTQSVYVKPDIQQQKDAGRVTEKSTMEWWKKQDQDIYKEAVGPNGRVSVEDSLSVLREFYVKHCEGRKFVPIWIRGTLDQVCMDSLAKQFGVELIAPYNVYRDVRTGVELLYNAPTGYTSCSKQVPFSCKKHHPINDCIIDAMMLCYGIPV